MKYLYNFVFTIFQDPELPQSSAITTVTEDALEQSLGQTPLEGQQMVDTNSHKYIKHSKRMIERKVRRCYDIWFSLFYTYFVYEILRFK